MRFLIVGSFKAQAEKQLALWAKLVRTTVEECPQIRDLSEDYITVADPAELDRFVVDRHGAMATDSKPFDLLDIVLIFSDGSREPWHPANQKVQQG